MSEENTAVETTEAPETNTSTEASTESTAPAESSAAPSAEGNTEAASADQNAEKPEGEATDPSKPDWFMSDKYKSVEDQAKAYKDLSSKIGKNWGPPKEEYKIDGLEGVAKDDPLLANLAPALKEIGLSQDGFNNLVKSFQQANVAMAKKFEEELKKELTQNDAHTYNSINSWMQEALKPEEVEQIKNNWLMTPQDFKLFNALRLMIGPSTNVPSHADNPGPRFESAQQVENEKIKYRKEVKEGFRVKDKNFEDQLAARYRDAVAREERSRR